MFPTIVADYILNRTLNQQAVAYLKISATGQLLESGGLLLAYGLDQLKPGAKVIETAVFLEGLLPLQRDTLFLPNVQTISGVVADLHLFKRGEDAWVVLMEATRHVIEQTPIQQQSNEYMLLQEKQARNFEEQLGRSTSEDLLKKFSPKQYMVLMLLHVTNLGDYAAKHGAMAAFTNYSQLLEEFLPAIQNRDGSIEKVSENTIRVLFAVQTEDELSAEQKALGTASYLVDLAKERRFGGTILTQDSLQIGIAITAGNIDTGIINIRQRKMFGIMGTKVEEAQHLSGLVTAGEILVDNTTYVASGSYAEHFEKADGYYRWLV